MILAIGKSKGFTPLEIKISNRGNKRFLTGFTLIEIMVSIAILSFGLILILQGFTQSLNALRISRNNLKTTLLAEEKITEIQIEAKQSTDLYFGNLSGESDIDNIEFKWETSIIPDEEYEHLNKVRTTVSWKEGRRKGAVPLVTYLRTPPNEEK